jgi:hypothetical protein
VLHDFQVEVGPDEGLAQCLTLCALRAANESPGKNAVADEREAHRRQVADFGRA